MPDNIDYIKPKSNDDYINKIRKNLEENAAARAEREKRRRKVLVDQMKAHEAQEVIFLLALKVNLILGFQIFKILNKIAFLTNTTWWKFCKKNMKNMK